jgi:FAD/FMN-containing dehydrogenase
MAAPTPTKFIAPPTAGCVSGPGEARYDEERTAWNLAVEQRPAAVAVPRDADQIAATVAAAAAQGLRVAAQGTGHGAAPLGDLADTVLIRTHRMRGVEIDSARRRARVEAGAQWSDVTDAAARHGLAALAGSAPDVGVVGYTLGGGLSWMARQHGLAVNHVEAIDVVAADGELLRASAAENPELFYALRGGGGSFGVVTAIEFALFEIAEVYAGMLLFPIARAQEVLSAYGAWTRELPESVTSLGRLLNLPPLPDIPEALRGRSFVGVEAAMLESEHEGRRLLEPLRRLAPEIDTFATIRPAELGRLHMDPPGPVAGIGDSTALAELADGAVEALVLAAGEHSGSPLLSVELRHLGGAVGRSPAGAGALGALDMEFCVFGVGMALDAEMAAAVDAHLCLVMDALSPWAAAQRYLNFCDRLGDDPSRMFRGADHLRLRELKRTLDPSDTFRANHHIAVAG